MGKKKDKSFILPGDTDNDHNEDYLTLNYKPKIEFVEPDQEPYEYSNQPPPLTIDEEKDDTEQLMSNLENLKKLLNAAQQKIDKRVQAGGGVTIALDPLKDANVIAAMKRKFPDKADPTKLTYEDYRDALDCVNTSAKPIESITEEDLLSSLSDPLRTSFGGYDNQQGENRPELSDSGSPVDPIDIAAFQKGAIIALFLLLLPFITLKIKKEIGEHLLTAPHSPI